MSKCESKKTNNRENWTGELVFYTGSKYDHLSHGSLVEEMNGHEGIDYSEELRQMELYKTPLRDWQLTQLVLSHQFVLIDSRSWWWTIERNNKCLLLQRNRKYDVVRDYNEESLRNTPVEEIKRGDCKGTMKDLIWYLYVKKELEKKYNFVDNNCKIFANAVFDRFVVEGTVRERCYIMWTETLKMKSCFIVI